jgi:hypothetical protein
METQDWCTECGEPRTIIDRHDEETCLVLELDCGHHVEVTC